MENFHTFTKVGNGLKNPHIPISQFQQLPIHDWSYFIYTCGLFWNVVAIISFINILVPIKNKDFKILESISLITYIPRSIYLIIMLYLWTKV